MVGAGKGVFWSSLWDWHDVIGDKGTRLLINEDQMPELLFPDASINYAQNMLAEADDRPAIIAYGEDGRCTRLTRAELKTTVMALAGWMQSKGSAEVTELLPTCQMVNMR